MKRRHVILKRKKKVIIRLSIKFQVVTGNFHRNETNHTNASQGEDFHMPEGKGCASSCFDI